MRSEEPENFVEPAELLVVDLVVAAGCYYCCLVFPDFRLVRAHDHLALLRA